VRSIKKTSKIKKILKKRVLNIVRATFDNSISYLQVFFSLIFYMRACVFKLKKGRHETNGKKTEIAFDKKYE
jgi:hypothetical protein